MLRCAVGEAQSFEVGGSLETMTQSKPDFGDRKHELREKLNSLYFFDKFSDDSAGLVEKLVNQLQNLMQKKGKRSRASSLVHDPTKHIRIASLEFSDEQMETSEKLANMEMKFEVSQKKLQEVEAENTRLKKRYQEYLDCRRHGDVITEGECVLTGSFVTARQPLNDDSDPMDETKQLLFRIFKLTKLLQDGKNERETLKVQLNTERHQEWEEEKLKLDSEIEFLVDQHKALKLEMEAQRKELENARRKLVAESRQQEENIRLKNDDAPNMNLTIRLQEAERENQKLARQVTHFDADNQKLREDLFGLRNRTKEMQVENLDLRIQTQIAGRTSPGSIPDDSLAGAKEGDISYVTNTTRANTSHTASFHSEAQTLRRKLDVTLKELDSHKEMLRACEETLAREKARQVQQQEELDAIIREKPVSPRMWGDTDRVSQLEQELQRERQSRYDLIKDYESQKLQRQAAIQEKELFKDDWKRTYAFLEESRATLVTDESKVKVLEEEILNLRYKFDIEEQVKEELRGETRELNQFLDQLKLKNLDLQAELNISNSERNRLTEEVKVISEQSCGADALEARIRVSHSETDRMTRQCDRLRLENAQADKAIHELREKIKGLVLENSKLSHELNEQLKHVRTLSSQNATLELDLARDSDLNQQYKIETFEKTRDLDSIKTDNVRLEEDLRRTVAENSRQDRQIQEALKDNQILARENMYLHGQIEKITQERESVAHQQEDLRVVLAGERDAKELTRVKMEDLQKTLKVQEVELRKWEASVNSVQAAKKTMASELEVSRTECLKLTQELETSRINNQCQKNETEAIRHQLTLLTHRLDQDHGETEAHYEQKALLTQDLASFQSLLRMNENKFLQNQAELAEARRTCESLTQANLLSESNRKDLQRSLHTAETRAKQLNEVILKQRCQIMDFEAKLLEISKYVKKNQLPSHNLARLSDSTASQDLISSLTSNSLSRLSLDTRKADMDASPTDESNRLISSTDYYKSLQKSIQEGAQKIAESQK